jgi:hypothetical protein
VDTHRDQQRLRRIRTDEKPVRMTGTAVRHVLPNGKLTHNYVERNAFEVFQWLTGR